MVDSLIKVTTCAVCLEVLKLDTVVCVNGHVICADCKRTQPSCPTCRKGFSNVENASFVRQVLEVIPHTCRYKGCPHVVHKGDDHETYCEYRHTQCRYPGCTWEGCVKDLHHHCQSRHVDLTISGMRVKTTVDNFHLKKMSPAHIMLHNIFGNFFWQKREYTPNTGVMSFTVIPVLRKKPTYLLSEITFHERHMNEKPTAFTTFAKQVHYDSGEGLTDKNTIYVPITILQQFWDEKNFKIEYTSKWNEIPWY